MKKIVSVLGVILLSSIANAVAVSKANYSSVTNHEKSDQFGVGLSVGSLTGLSTQYWLSWDRTLNATFAVQRENSAVSLAHLWLYHDAFASGGRQANYFIPYIGVGGIVSSGTESDYFTRDNENFAAAVQVPLEWSFCPDLNVLISTLNLHPV